MSIPPPRGTAQFAVRRHTFVPLVCIVAVALAGMLLPRMPLPRLEIAGPITYAIAVLADLGTAVVLFSTWRVSPARRAAFALALAFSVSAILMLFAMLTLPLMPSVLPVLPSLPQAGIWLYVGWHVTAALGAFVYIALRRNDTPNAPSLRFMAGATVIAVGFLGAVAALAFVFSEHLPTLVTSVSFKGMLTSGVGPSTLGLLIIAAVLTFRLRTPSAIDRALAFALVALALDAALLFAGAPRYSAAFYTGRISLVLGASFVFIAALQTLVFARMRLHETEWKLSRVEGESEKRAARIRALWEITSNAALSQQERFNVVLATATAALRPGKPMFGCLTHLDEETIVVDSTSWMAVRSDAQFTDRVFPGATFPLEETMQSVLYAEQCTKAWDDLTCITDKTGKVCDRLGWRSYIGTTLTIGRQTHFLTFTSPETMLEEPFAEDDVAYVEVVASFFASGFSQQMQFERIQYQIEHDALTGLETRVQFRKAIREEIAGAKPFIVAFIDLDGFRHVNEQQGHQLGDEVLVEVAAGLLSIAKGDLVARMGGDEFAVLLRGTASAASGRTALERYADCFQSPFHTGDRLGTQMLRVGASIGAACFPGDGKSAEELMLRADAALCAAKSRGGSSTQFFDAGTEALMDESHIRVVELADAIAGDQLALVYQPTVDLATRRIVGAEALVRWDHPQRGRLLPAEFIGLAERNELITPLSRWVLARLMRDLANATHLPKGFRIYFNLSAQTLSNIPFVAEFSDTLRNAPDLVPHLGVELTETAAMENVESSMHTIDLFRRWGLFVAIDDFGTGYSSLSYLKQLTVDVIKIDRSFITGLPQDERDAAIADLLLRITDRFGFTTLAEGIETEAQAAWLLAHGCRVGQGYLFAKPCPYPELLQLLASPRAAA
jgi:diguanylate cyclase (GGDEF)-like protein